MRFLKPGFGAIVLGPGGFRELREACGTHFQLSWYLSDPMVPTYYRYYSFTGSSIIVKVAIYDLFAF